MHTISVGAAQPSDLNLHLEAVRLLPQADRLLAPVQNRLQSAAIGTLGERWVQSWRHGLPSWFETPGQINLPVLLWLHNILEAWDLESYARARYRLLGQGSHWFPGANADPLDDSVTESELLNALVGSPWRSRIPCILRGLKQRLSGEAKQRLSQV